MAVRIANLGLVASPNAPALNSLRGGNNALKHHVKQMLSAQDQPLTASRRVAWQGGMDGVNVNSVGDDHVGAGDITIKAHPYTDDELIMGQVAGFRLTPGHVLAVSARCLPSGHATLLVFGEPNGHFDDGQNGKIKIESTWESPGETSETVDIEIDFDGNGTSEFGHCGHATQSGFSALIEEYTLLFPYDMLFDPSQVEKYCREGVDVTLTVSKVGAVRPVDIVIYEIPYKLAFDDTTSNKVPGHVYQNSETPISNYPPDYAIEGSSGDPRMGVEWASEVSLAQVRSINPTCANWGCASEGLAWDTDVSELTLPPFEVTFFYFDASGMAHGQRFHNSNAAQLDDTGCVLAALSVYHEGNDGDEITIRVYDHNDTEIAYFDAMSDSSGFGVWDHFSFLVECGDSPLSRHVHSISLEGSGTASVCWLALRAIPELE